MESKLRQRVLEILNSPPVEIQVPPDSEFVEEENPLETIEKALRLQHQEAQKRQ